MDEDESIMFVKDMILGAERVCNEWRREKMYRIAHSVVSAHE